MKDYKLKTGKAGKTAVEGYKKIEERVVGGYKKIEETVVSEYKKIEDAFVDTFLEVGENPSSENEKKEKKYEEQ